MATDLILSAIYKWRGSSIDNTRDAHCNVETAWVNTHPFPTVLFTQVYYQSLPKLLSDMEDQPITREEVGDIELQESKGNGNLWNSVRFQHE